LEQELHFMKAKIIAPVLPIMFVALAEGAPDGSFQLMQTFITDICCASTKP
jgi:hypothetical protein